MTDMNVIINIDTDTDTMTVTIENIAPVVDGEWEACPHPSGWDLQRYDDEDGWHFASLTRDGSEWVVTPGRRDAIHVRPLWRIAT